MGLMNKYAMFSTLDKVTKNKTHLYLYLAFTLFALESLRPTLFILICISTL